MPGVIRHAAPVHPAYVAWKDDCAFEARRSEQTFRARILNELATSFAIFRRQTPGVLGSQLLRNNRGREPRERLSRRRFFSGNCASRDRAFFAREQRLPGLP